MIVSHLIFFVLAALPMLVILRFIQRRTRSDKRGWEDGWEDRREE
jgi:hypothetical protein